MPPKTQERCISVLCLSLLCTALAARAGQAEAPVHDVAPAPAPAQPPESKPTVWEGALGLTTSYRPEYSGAARQIFKVSPALFLRYGRFTITNASGFVTRRADDVMRGLGMDMVRSDTVRVNLALRVDQGRGENASEALKGMGNIRATIRMRMAASWRIEGPWRTGASWSVDIAGRGGGQFGDIGGGWEQRIAPDTVLNIGGGLSFADGRYMQNFFGVTLEQAARTGYPVHEPGAGVRDVGAAINLRHDFGAEWTALAGASTTRLLGAAAASPLTGRKSTWGLSAGLARRF